MPLLPQSILIKLLKTYPGADKIEAKYNSLISEYKGKGNPPSHLAYIQNKIKEGASKLLSTSARWLGYNTPEDSEACYLAIRALIDDATKNHNMDAWIEIFCVAGEGGYQRYIKSAFTSRLCQASFALLLLIRKKITNKINLIKDPENTTDPDEIHAIQIDKAIQNRIKLTKQFIEVLTLALQLGSIINLSTVLANILEINVTTMKDLKEKAKDAIDIAYRHLLYLGDKSLKKDVFEGLPSYDIQVKKKYNLTPAQVENIDLQLPLYLQEIYLSLYIRDHRKDLFHLQDEDKVIKIFEESEKIIEQDNKAGDQKLISRNITPIKVPAIPKEQKIVEDEFAFGDVSDEKLGMLLNNATKEEPKQSDAVEIPILGSIVVPQYSVALESVSSASESKSKESEQIMPESAHDASVPQSSENAFFQAKSGSMNKGKSKNKTHSSENKPAHR